MQTILVDTDIAIDYLRGIHYAKELMHSLWDKNMAYLGILSVYELYADMSSRGFDLLSDICPFYLLYHLFCL